MYVFTTDLKRKFSCHLTASQLKEPFKYQIKPQVYIREFGDSLMELVKVLAEQRDSTRQKEDEEINSIENQYRLVHETREEEPRLGKDEFDNNRKIQLQKLEIERLMLEEIKARDGMYEFEVQILKGVSLQKNDS
ncbi:uncharacterized protein VTP21DRAFT_8144 [Calcarisporiella thermophila]|uniref:uncharacterized protein n=1 Tax=Calcarisporiella thermophila TaxID=911321 RepID=UPI003742457F